MGRLPYMFITFIFCFLSTSAQVQAIGYQKNINFFFDTTDDLQKVMGLSCPFPAEAFKPPLNCGGALPLRGFEADVIAEVILTDTIINSKLLTSTAKIVNVIKTSDAGISQGGKIAVKYVVTECDRPRIKTINGEYIEATGHCFLTFNNHSPNNIGTIIAKVGIDIDGRLVLCPYSNEPINGRVTPPLAGECNPDEMETAKQIKLAAENGDAKAQTALGLMYGEGRNARQDAAEAIKWFLLAAENGDIEALYQLGAEYNRTRNSTKAMWYFTSAAARGHAGAMYDIGRLYDGYGGSGVKRNESEAEKWYRLAADNGDERAKHTLKAIEKLKIEKLKRNIILGICILAGAGLTTTAAAIIMRRLKSRRTNGIPK